MSPRGERPREVSPDGRRRGLRVVLLPRRFEERVSAANDLLYRAAHLEARHGSARAETQRITRAAMRAIARATANVMRCHGIPVDDRGERRLAALFGEQQALLVANLMRMVALHAVGAELLSPVP